MSDETHIGQYKILRTLGAGGMGTVYLGEHILLGRRAAIKTLLPTLSSHREIVDRFFNEARAISAISDPGVVQIFDFGYHVDGTAYIVMEYLEGESLSSRIDRLGKLPLIEALRLVRQIASSLAAAHARGIIHRDLKPGNVFVIRDGEAQGGERTKILDFGICKLAGPESAGTGSTTETGTMLGTPVYMSPEQCRGGGGVDHRSDIYSVGCALYHMLTGRPPFDCESTGDFIAAHIKDDPEPPSKFAPELPTAVDELVLRCLEKRPIDRFQSMTQLQAAVEEVLSTLSDSGRAAPAGKPMVSATPLFTGFKSAYDVNRGNQIPTMDQTPAAPAHSWFVNSESPLPPSSVSQEFEWEEPERGMSPFQRIVLVGVLFVGLIGGLIGTSYALQNGDDIVATPVAIATPPEELTPGGIAAYEIAPPEPVAGVTEDATEAAETADGDASDEADVQVAQPEPVAEVAKPVQEAKPSQQAKPERPRAVRKTRPIPRRSTRPVEPETEPETEQEDDLYDTR